MTPVPDAVVDAVAALVADAVAERVAHGAGLMRQLRRDVSALASSLTVTRKILFSRYRWRDEIDADVMCLAKTLFEYQGLAMRASLVLAATVNYRLTAAGRPMPPLRGSPR